VVAAELALPGRPSVLPVVLGDLLTLRAVDAVRVQPPHEVGQAGVVVGEQPVPLEAGAARLRSRRSLGVPPVYLRHAKSVAQGCTAVKGIVPAHAYVSVN